jgi:SNF2 family DNA or RNA helicase
MDPSPLAANGYTACERADRPRQLFPRENRYHTVTQADGRNRCLGYSLPARADIALKLKHHYVLADQTPAYQAFVAGLVQQQEQEVQARSCTPAIPYLPGFGDELYPVQVQAIDFQLRNHFVLLACDMGLGKTRTALYGQAAALAQRVTRKCLILGPASALSGGQAWEKELTRALVPYTLIRTAAVYAVDTPFVLVSPEQLLTHLRSGKITVAELAQLFDGVILDESSRVGKDWNVLSGILRELRPSLKTLVFLNGTPIENRIRELWEQVDILRPGLLGTWEAFRARHGIQDEQKPCPVLCRELLQRELLPVVFVARLEEIGKSVPPLLTETLVVALSPAQQLAYDAVEDYLKNAATDEDRLKCYTVLQQVCDSPSLVGYPEHESAKETLFRESVLPGLTAWGRKSILYSGFETWITELAGKYGGPDPLIYKGGRTPKQRDELSRRFKTDPRELLLWGTGAITKALNLQEAWHVVSLDLPWSAAVYQLVARARRGDTDHKVTWLRIISDTPFEQRKLALIEQKWDLLQDTVMSLPDLLKAGVLSWKELLQW